MGELFGVDVRTVTERRKTTGQKLQRIVSV